jgi:hypothetical protein
MKRNELKQLYDYYVQHTAVVEKMGSVKMIQDYLSSKDLQLNITNCAIVNFEIHCFISDNFLYPYHCVTKLGIISALNQRIEFLRSELLKNMQNFADKLPSGLCKVEFDYLEYRGDNLEIDIDEDEIRFKGNTKYLKLWVEN